MRYARPVSIAFSAVLALGILVACGGGGGGGSNPPPANVSAPSNPQAPNPSAGSTTPPSSSTTPPSGSAATTPPGTSTTPPSTSTTPPATPTPTQTISGQTVSVGYGQTNGDPKPLLVSSAQNTQGYSGGGNLKGGDPGSTSTGGGQGQTVDGIACAPTMNNYYHVHIFVGVIHNGQEVAVPAGVGMVNPHPPNEEVYNDATPAPGTTPNPNSIGGQSWTANCYYDFHVHDNSGMIHVETGANGMCGAWTNGGSSTPAPVATPNEKPCNYPAPWTLQNFLDIWGISVTPSQFGPLSGSVQVYTTPPGYNAYSACPSSEPIVNTPCETMSTSYQSTTLANALSMPLYSHTTFWFVVGSPGAYTTASSLPNVNWVEGNP